MYRRTSLRLAIDISLRNLQGKHTIGKLFGNRLRIYLQLQSTPMCLRRRAAFETQVHGHAAGNVPFLLLDLLPNVLIKALSISVVFVLLALSAVENASITTIEFENVAEFDTRKWRQSIKCNGKELGDWSFDHGLEPQDTSHNQNESKLSQILQMPVVNIYTDSACNQATGGTSELLGGTSAHKSVFLATGCSGNINQCATHSRAQRVLTIRDRTM